MISIGAESSPRNMSPEVRSLAKMFGLSPCPERSWRWVRTLHLCGESRVLSVIACNKGANALQTGAILCLSLRQITRHTMQSNFTRKSLKTNDGHPYKVTYKTRSESPENEPILEVRRAAPESLATSHSLVLSPVEGSLATGLNFPNLAARGPHRIPFQEESYEIE